MTTTHRIAVIRSALLNGGPKMRALAALDALEAELDQARLSIKTLVKEDGVVVSRQRAELLAAREALTAARGLAEWLLTLDDPEDVLGREERRAVTLTQIIGRARAVLAAPAEAES